VGSLRVAMDYNKQKTVLGQVWFFPASEPRLAEAN